MGDVDRGADIDCLSLFPGEKEVLPVPALAVLFASIEMLLLRERHVGNAIHMLATPFDSFGVG